MMDLTLDDAKRVARVLREHMPDAALADSLDEARAREFYIDDLHFAIEWEHRFEDGLPKPILRAHSADTRTQMPSSHIEMPASM